MNGAEPSNPPPPSTAAASSLLAPGFRFHPTDEELVSYYLKRKVAGRALRVDVIAEVDVYKCEPWDLPGLSKIKGRDLEWYFFSTVDRKYSNRSRNNRATAQGYWKTTGKDRPVRHGNRNVGMKKTLVYHEGRAPKGKRSDWVMHEYRLEDEEHSPSGIPQDGYVVCRIFQKRGAGPQNGAQYGAPYLEEEWEEEMDGLPVITHGEDKVNNAVGQEYLQLTDFEQSQNLGDQHGSSSVALEGSNSPASGSHQDQTDFFDEVLDYPAFMNEMIEYISESGPPSCSQTHNEDMGIKSAIEDCTHCPPSQNDEYLELNDLADVVRVEYPSSEDFVNYPLRTCYPQNSVDGLSDDSNLNKAFDVEDFLEQPELLQMSSIQKNSYLQSNDLNNLYLSFKEGEDNMVFYDAPSDDRSFKEEKFMQLSELHPPLHEPSSFETFDDLMAYFDATDDSLHYDTNVFPENSKYFNPSEWSQSNISKEVHDPRGVAEPKDLASNIEGGASSSALPAIHGQYRNIYQDAKVAAGFQKTVSTDNSITKRLVNMLGSISAPPAFAAEFPSGSGKSVGETSTMHSDSSIHVTAGVIHIGGLAVAGSGERWTLQKSGDLGLLFSYSMTDNFVGKSEGFVPITKVHGGAVSVVLRGGFFLFFLSACFLILSYKVGMCVYGR